MIEAQFRISYSMLSDVVKDIDEKQADFQLELAKIILNGNLVT